MTSDLRPAGEGEGRFQQGSGCPSHRQLEASCNGTVTLQELSQLEEHLAACPACEQALGKLIHSVPPAEKPTGKASNTPGFGRGKVVDSGNLILGEAQLTSSHPGVNSRAGESAEPTAPLQIGPYRLERRIGIGGMGVVFKAWQERLNRHVAIKLLPSSKTFSQPDIDRLHQEMKAVGNLNHENVVFAIDAAESEGVHYLVMEYVEGRNLAELIEDHGKLSAADVCEIGRQTAVGLAHIHAQGLVHRDLKPSNLMVDAQGTVKILDLGLAKVRAEKFLNIDELTQSGYILGTSDYLAPEQAADAHSADIRSDLYSLGCTLFKLLTGQAPFSGKQYDSATKKLIAHAQVPPPRVSEFRSDVPPELDLLINRLLEKNPDRRPGDPGEILPILKKLSMGHQIEALVPGNAQRTSRGSSLEPTQTKTLNNTSRWSAEKGSTRARLWDSALARWSVAGAAVLLITLSGWAIYHLAGASGDHHTTPSLDQPDSFAAVEYHIPVRPPTIVPNPKTGSLFLMSPDPVLLRLGKLSARTGVFRVACDHSQGDWGGQFGVFMGLHELHDADGRPHTVAQFINIQMGIEMSPEGKPSPRGPRLMVERSYKTLVKKGPEVSFDPTPFKSLNSPVEFVDVPPVGQALRLELHFANGLLSKVVANGQPLPELTTGDFHDRMSAHDTLGPFGVFVASPRGVTYSNFDFSILQRD